MAYVLQWLMRYGYGALFTMLMLGIVGLPVPDEVLLLTAGQLAWQGVFKLPLVMVIAFCGAVCGISLSFTIGRLVGMAMLRRGKFWRLRPEHLKRVCAWLERWGKWTFVFGYYVPGFRHAVALVAGASRWPLRHFMPFAYGGAAIWSATFILLGFFFGHDALRLVPIVHRYMEYVIAAAVALLATAATIWWYRRRAKARLEVQIGRRKAA